MAVDVTVVPMDSNKVVSGQTVVVTKDRITAVGHFPAKAKRTINANQLTLIPGIIDPHSHADLLLPLPPDKQAELLKCKLAQGITTTIIGNCGLGCAPVADAACQGRRHICHVSTKTATSTVAATASSSHVGVNSRGEP